MKQKTKRYAVILALFLCVVFSLKANAAELTASMIDRYMVNNDLLAIKAETVKHLSRQEELEKEYQELKQEFIILQKGIYRKEDDIEKIIEPKKRKIKLQKMIVDSFPGALEEHSDDVLLRKSRNAHLSRELIDTNERKRFLKLQLADLEIEKRQLELDIKLKKYLLDDDRSQKSNKLALLEDELRGSLERERELEEKITELKTEDFSPEKVNRIKQENRMLSDEIKGTEKDLQAEYDALDDTIKMSAKRKKLKSKLLKSVIELDRENHDLRSKIAELKREGLPEL